MPEQTEERGEGELTGQFDAQIEHFPGAGIDGHPCLDRGQNSLGWLLHIVADHVRGRGKEMGTDRDGGLAEWEKVIKEGL